MKSLYIDEDKCLTHETCVACNQIHPGIKEHIKVHGCIEFAPDGWAERMELPKLVDACPADAFIVTS